ncbi:MAG: DUF169 domain-containing protein [Deltaproteobacteria bacterium]|nr:DUF169 domain-containing protein [Deltaproteobacteria bacterium]
MSIQKLGEAVEAYVRPLTFPLGVKFLSDKEIPQSCRRPSKLFGYRINICQGVNMARRYGWNLGFLEDDMACPLSIPIFGFRDDPEFVTQGTHIYPDFTDSLEAAARTQAAQPKAPTGSISGVLMGPANRVDFDPDLALVYGSPAQIVRMVQAALYSHGGAIQSSFSGRCACAQEFVYPYLNKKCNVIIPAQGERLFAMTADDELVFAVPRGEFENVAQGLEITHKRGVSRIPTPFFGMRMQPQFPERYAELEEYCGTRSDDAPAKE